MSIVGLKLKARAQFAAKEGELLWNTRTGAIEGELRTLKDVLSVLGASVLGRLEGKPLGRPSGTGIYRSAKEFWDDMDEVSAKLSQLSVKGRRPREMDIAALMDLTEQTYYRYKRDFPLKPE